MYSAGEPGEQCHRDCSWNYAKYLTFKSGTLYTSTASRPLRVVYFDGMSAAKTPEGTLDLQNVFIFGDADGPDSRRPPHSDYDRGKLLCEWGRKFGIEGFVRGSHI
jgi:hypothetical protein